EDRVGVRTADATDARTVPGDQSVVLAGRQRDRVSVGCLRPARIMGDGKRRICKTEAVGCRRIGSLHALAARWLHLLPLPDIASNRESLTGRRRTSACFGEWRRAHFVLARRNED